MLKELKKYLASKIPTMKLLPNQTFTWSWLDRKSKQKSVIPKNPTTKMLRQFSQDAIVRKAISMAQDRIASMPYRINVIGGRGKYLKQIEVITNIIENPNVVDTRESFFKRLLDDALVLDAMAVEVCKGRDVNHPIYLYPVDGSTIQYVVPYSYDQPNAVRYSQQQQEGMKYFTAQDIAYLQRSYFTYQPFGLSPVMSAYKYITYFLDSIEQANTRATNATSEFILSLGEEVSDDERRKFEEYFRNEIEGTGKVPIISGSKSVESKQIKAINDDGLYLSWQQKLTQIIGVAFSIPQERLGVSISTDRSTFDDEEHVITEGLIKPYASMIEMLINKYVIDKLGLGGVLKFQFIYETSEAQRTAKSTRIIAEYYRGAITENEFRSMMGYEPSNSKYADMTYPEKTANINVDLGIAGGFNGNGGILKDTSSEVNRQHEYDTGGGDKNG